MPKGTLLQLIAKGERENILTGNPEVTFSKKHLKDIQILLSNLLDKSLKEQQNLVIE